MWHPVKGEEVEGWGTLVGRHVCGSGTGLGRVLQGHSQAWSFPWTTHPQISSGRRSGHLQRGLRSHLHLPILSQSKGTGPRGGGVE